MLQRAYSEPIDARFPGIVVWTDRTRHLIRHDGGRAVADDPKPGPPIRVYYHFGFKPHSVFVSPDGARVMTKDPDKDVSLVGILWDQKTGSRDP